MKKNNFTKEEIRVILNGLWFFKDEYCKKEDIPHIESARKKLHSSLRKANKNA